MSLVQGFNLKLDFFSFFLFIAFAALVPVRKGRSFSCKVMH